MLLGAGIEVRAKEERLSFLLRLWFLEKRHLDGADVQRPWVFVAQAVHWRVPTARPNTFWAV